LPFAIGKQIERKKPLGFLNKDGKEAAWIENRYKLISRKKGNELYDLISDPGETINLIKKAPKIAKQMEGQLLIWRTGVMAELKLIPK
ncbi:hypothetical protein N9234_03010, partial [Akkermansiaceae bacterium]|nr:hypothetical protein [Akkermansiaceae bacterium]